MPLKKRNSKEVEEEEEEPKKIRKSTPPPPEPEDDESEEDEEEEDDTMSVDELRALGSQDLPEDVPVAGLFPIGVHVAQLTKSAFKAKKKGGKLDNLQVIFTYTGLNGEAENQSIQQYYTVMKEGKGVAGCSFFKKDMMVLGFDEDELSLNDGTLIETIIKMPEVVQEDEILVELTVKQNGAYRNCYLNKLVSGSHIDTDEDDDDDDIPY